MEANVYVRQIESGHSAHRYPFAQEGAADDFLQLRRAELPLIPARHRPAVFSYLAQFTPAAGRAA
jgi:hypothetical protein